MLICRVTHLCHTPKFFSHLSPWLSLAPLWHCCNNMITRSSSMCATLMPFMLLILHLCVSYTSGLTLHPHMCCPLLNALHFYIRCLTPWTLLLNTYISFAYVLNYINAPIMRHCLMPIWLMVISMHYLLCTCFLHLHVLSSVPYTFLSCAHMLPWVSIVSCSFVTLLPIDPDTCGFSHGYLSPQSSPHTL